MLILATLLAISMVGTLAFIGSVSLWFTAKQERSSLSRKCSDPGCGLEATINDTCALHPKSGALPPSFYKHQV
jgi:hypothetical protein